VDVLGEEVSTIYGILGTKINANFKYTDLNNNKAPEYEFVLLPGGVKALEKIRQQQNILDFINTFVGTGKTVASTCHGAQLLISAKVTKGRKISGYYSIKDDIENSGATYVDQPVVVDENIVSSPHYDHMGAWMKKALEIYNNGSL